MLLIALVGIAGLVVWFGGRDGLGVLGMGTPELAVSLSALEISIYLDALAVIVAAASMARFRVAVVAVVTKIRRVARRAAKARKARHRSVDRQAANDNERLPIAVAA